MSTTEINKITVVGPGMMGHAIAQEFASAGRYPPQRHTGFNNLYPARALPWAVAARCAAPHLFGFDIGQSKGGFPDDPTHAERSHPVPRTYRIA